jgi:hypothetical protein
MMNKDRFTNHPIFRPQPVGSVGGAKPRVQSEALQAESLATEVKEMPWIAAKIYRPSPVVNTNSPINLGGGSGMISRIYQQVAPTPEEVEQKKQAERTVADKIRNWIEFGKFL